MWYIFFYMYCTESANDLDLEYFCAEFVGFLLTLNQQIKDY